MLRYSVEDDFKTFPKCATRSRIQNGDWNFGPILLHVKTPKQADFSANNQSLRVLIADPGEERFSPPPEVLLFLNDRILAGKSIMGNVTLQKQGRRAGSEIEHS